VQGLVFCDGLGGSGQNWRRSSRSWGNGNCVEVAGLSSTTLVRDSKAPHRLVLQFTPKQWGVFLDCVRDGKFDC
jgi:hypothetical protein